MRKVIITLALICFGMNAQAQIENDKNCFNHLSIGAGVGTTGINIEVGTTICPFIALRTGVDFMVGSYKWKMDFEQPSGWYDIVPAMRKGYLPNDNFEAEFKASANIVNGKLLFDIFTGKNSMFHFTVGTYFGSNKFATAKAHGEVVEGIGQFNRDIDNKVPGIGNEYFTLYGYRIGIDQGRAQASLKINAFKPYIGFGIGRTCPRKRVGVKFDMGVMFWGKPVLHDDYRNIDVDKNYSEVLNGKNVSVHGDLKDGLDIANKICVYPTLKLTVFGRIF